MGVGDAVQNSKALDNAVAELAFNFWSKPLVTRAKKIQSLLSFKTSVKGMPIGKSYFTWEKECMNSSTN